MSLGGGICCPPRVLEGRHRAQGLEPDHWARSPAQPLAGQVADLFVPQFPDLPNKEDNRLMAHVQGSTQAHSGRVGRQWLKVPWPQLRPISRPHRGLHACPKPGAGDPASPVLLCLQLLQQGSGC